MLWRAAASGRWRRCERHATAEFGDDSFAPVVLTSVEPGERSPCYVCWLVAVGRRWQVHLSGTLGSPCRRPARGVCRCRCGLPLALGCAHSCTCKNRLTSRRMCCEHIRHHGSVMFWLGQPCLVVFLCLGWLGRGPTGTRRGHAAHHGRLRGLVWRAPGHLRLFVLGVVSTLADLAQTWTSPGRPRMRGLTVWLLALVCGGMDA